MAFANRVKVGERFRVEIKRITRVGDGYVKIKGVSIFVKNVDLGWKGEIVIKRLGPTYAIAEPVGE